MGIHMTANFELLKERIIDVNEESNQEEIKNYLNMIKDNVICVGSGGSNVVSEYACKVFNKKNNCVTINREPRDLLYENISNFKNIFICSYKGRNYGVSTALNNSLNKFLFTNGKRNIKDVSVIKFDNKIERERSFISLGSTLMPMSILLNYYLNGENFNNLINEMFDSVDEFNIGINTTFEIISGYDTSVAARYLRSTMIEAGLAVPVIHSKYEYCHAGTTLAYNNNHSLIYLHNGLKELDNLILSEASKLYKEVIILTSNYNDIVIDNFNLTLKAMYLTKALAELQNKDLSKIKYVPFLVSKLYHFKAEM